MTKQLIWVALGWITLTVVLPSIGAAADVGCRKKSGALVVRTGACKKREMPFTGALGPQGNPGAQGPPGPTASAYVESGSTTQLGDSPVQIVRLSDGPAGGLVTNFPAHIVLSGSVTLRNGGSDGMNVTSQCALEFRAGANFASVGLGMRSETHGNNNHDEYATIAVLAEIDEPAGAYDARINCENTFPPSQTIINVTAAALSAVAIAQ